jgi:hypothetical protein
MQIKQSTKRIYVVFFALILLMLASDSLAFFYRPGEPVRILSEYKAFTGSETPDTKLWKVIPEPGSGDAMMLRFFIEGAAATDPVCTIELPSFGPAGKIRRQVLGDIMVKSSDTGLLMAPGFPAPCDILPIGVEDERVYQEKTEAGGSVFIRTYRVSSAAFSLEEAKAKGWIKVEAGGIPELILVTATDEKGQRAVSQLWPALGSWWLYEETPLRRSWRID